jgi:hypothetical protein
MIIILIATLITEGPRYNYDDLIDTLNFKFHTRTRQK